VSYEEIQLCLRELKLKITPLRVSVVSMLESSSSPVSALDLLSQSKANKTTIYRELETLLSSGLISEINLGDGVRRYEMATSPHHHHLICTKCKSITNVEIQDDFTETEKSIAKDKKFKIQNHHLEFLGLCQDCC
jgi:Fur family ferric uptake transcriptional regulator